MGLEALLRYGLHGIQVNGGILPRPARTDKEALRSDWERAGRDLQYAFSKMKRSTITLFGSKTVKPIDWILVTIAQAGNQPLRPVQLQKSLFLLGRTLSPKQLQTDEFYEFEPYDYGPFCSAVYSDAEMLEKEGLVVIQRPLTTRYNLYGTTEAGARKAKELESGLDKEVLEYVSTIVGFTQSVSFNQLVTAIYKAYPEMKANSVFQE